jgi:hypothetical protein
MKKLATKDPLMVAISKARKMLTPTVTLKNDVHTVMPVNTSNEAPIII